MKGKHDYLKLDVNKMASDPWVARQLITNYKTNLRIELTERYGLSLELHTSYRARKLLKEWIKGNIKMHTLGCLNILKRLRQQILGQLHAFGHIVMGNPYLRGFSCLLRP